MKIALAVAALAALLPVFAPAQQRADRSQPPALGPAVPLSLPAIDERRLRNGLRVWLVPSHEVPLVQVNLVVFAGSGDDPTGSFGLASLTAAMLDEGAGPRTALEIADAVEFLGAELGVTSSFDASTVRMNVPVRALDAALEIMADVVLRPAFSARELERLRQERLTALVQSRDDPAAVATPAFARVVFGGAHRYGTSTIGTTATLEAFRARDLRAFHAELYRPGNATLIVVGDVTAATAMPILEHAFGAWLAAEPAKKRAVPAAPQLTAREVTIVDMPGAAQSQVRIGAVGAARSTADYFALQVLNTVLGGSFTSRLNQNLREQHGYAYGAGSRFDLRLAPGPFTASAGVQTDKTAEALGEFFKELDAIAAPIGAAELAKAKNYLALGFPADFETIGAFAARLEELAVYGLPLGFYTGYAASVAAVTAADVQRAAQRYVRPDAFAVVVVGDRRAIEPGIRALDLGPVRVVGVDDVVP